MTQHSYINYSLLNKMLCLNNAATETEYHLKVITSYQPNCIFLTSHPKLIMTLLHDKNILLIHFISKTFLLRSIFLHK